MTLFYNFSETMLAIGLLCGLIAALGISREYRDQRLRAEREHRVQ